MKPIPIRPLPVRIGLFALLACGLGWLGWNIARDAWGDSLVTALMRSPGLGNRTRLATADEAARYAPGDPFVRRERGTAYFNAANEEQNTAYANTAVAELREAARLSPNDARVWLILGKALARTGDNAGAKEALTRATQLAPNHFDTHWTLGNQLLRVGERDAAFAALQTALVKRPAALPLVFEYAWNFYQGDAAAVIRALNPPPALRAATAARLIAHGQIETAMQLWKQSDTQAAPAATLEIVQSLQRIGRQHAAYDIWRTLPDVPKEDGNSVLANGSFEQPIDLNSSVPFLTWRIVPSPGFTVGLDPQVFSAGRLGLRLRFDVKENIALILAEQVAIVAPRTTYRLQYRVKTEELQSLSTPFVVVQDAADDKRLSVATAALSVGSADWTDYKTDFVTPAATEAVVVRLMRMPCNEPPCPLSGRVWFDEFQLSPTGKKAP